VPGKPNAADPGWNLPHGVTEGYCWFSVFNLERPGRGATEDGGAGESDGAVPFRDQKSAGRVSFWTGAALVMGAKSLFDLAESFGALGTGLALEVQGKSLSANGALGFYGGFAGFAQYLHFVFPLYICRVSPGHNLKIPLGWKEKHSPCRVI